MAAKALSGIAREFARRPSPRLLLAAVAGGAALRLAVAPLAATDAVVAAAVALAQPFVEWLVHLNVLHARPFHVLGRTVDLGASHRVHHEDPRDLAHVLLDARYLAVALAGVAALWAVAFARHSPVLATLLVVLPAGALAYEWTHWLTHSPYAPRTALPPDQARAPPAPPPRRALLARCDVAGRRRGAPYVSGSGRTAPPREGPSTRTRWHLLIKPVPAATPRGCHSRLCHLWSLSVTPSPPRSPAATR